MQIQKVIFLVLIGLTMLLTGCSAKDEAAYSIEDAQTLMDAGAFSGELVPLEASNAVIASLYGIDEETIEDFISYRAINSSVSADEVTVLILTDEDAAQSTATAFQAYIENQIKSYQYYCPAAIPSLDAAIIKQVDNTVLLAVGNPDTLSTEVSRLHE